MVDEAGDVPAHSGIAAPRAVDAEDPDASFGQIPLLACLALAVAYELSGVVHDPGVLGDGLVRKHAVAMHPGPPPHQLWKAFGRLAPRRLHREATVPMLALYVPIRLAHHDGRFEHVAQVARGQRRRLRPGRGHAAALQQHDLGDLRHDFLQPVRHEQDGRALPGDIPDGIEKRPARHDVQARCRLVEDEHLRVVDESASDEHAPRFARGHLVQR